jgi:hypothetical protein
MTGAALLPLAAAAAAGWSQMEGMDRSMAMGPAPRPVAKGPTVPTDTCGGGILPAGDPANPHDLLIKGITCRVDGTKTVAGAKDNGIYVYRNVNIVNGGTLVFSDAAIDFHAHSILVERGGTLSAGADSPIKNKLTIYLWGGPNSKTQTWSTTDLNPSVTCKSDSDPNVSTCGIPSDVWNSNPGMAMRKMPMPGTPCKKASEVAAKDPFKPGSTFALPVDDCFYQYDVIDAGSEAGAYFGRKVLAVSEGGNLMLRGAKGIRDTTVDNCPTEDVPSGGGFIEKCPADSGTSWVHLSTTLKGGESAFDVDRAVPTWAKYDHIVVTTTDFLPGHSEELEIVSVTANSNGTSHIVVKGTVNFPHVGDAYSYAAARDLDSEAGPDDDAEIGRLTDIPAATKITPTTQVETRAIVALLTRNIVIASEGASVVLGRDHPESQIKSDDHFPIVKGSTASYYGGHVIVRQGVQTFKVQGVEFYQLGQGGLIGRYPVHFHMDRLVPRPLCTSKFNTPKKKYDVTCTSTGTYLADSSIVDSMTRFVTVHATQGVTLARNVGYQSIGQGYYLEDATETDNRLYSNVAITMRAGIADAITNPRNVPGILQWDRKKVTNPDGTVNIVPMGANEQMPDDFPLHSDVNNPSAFWIQNAWNDIEYNAAVGCQTCGSCYWFPPAGISGPSVYENWTGYASIQGGSASAGHWGTAPFYNFRGNSCSAAMFALQTVGSTVQCNRIQYGGNPMSDGNVFGAVVNKNTPKDESSFPYEVGQRNHATLCSDANLNGDCTKTPVCLPTDKNESTCAATVVDRFTTSFNWAPKNFAAVWMRGWWQLLQNSAITDQFKGGLTFVSGGGFTRSDAAQGFWSVLKNSVLVGQTQEQFEDPNGADYPANPAASVAGPFNLKALACDQATGGSACLSYRDGINMLNESFGDYEHLFNIYDGPAAQYNNIYADVNVTKIGVDTRNADIAKNGSKCVNAPDLSSSNCTSFGFQATRNNGNVVRRNTNAPTDTIKLDDECFIPNSAIAWKQPNGFYYPPAFHSDNLVFSNVDIRHYVIQPLFKDYAVNYFQTSVDKCTSGTPEDQKKCQLQSIPYNYCSWASNMFAGTFSDIDRETELTDDDGSLTGLTATNISEPPTERPSISVTKATFNNAPVTTDECASGQLSFNKTPVEPTANGTGDATVNTSPYEYMSLAVFRGSTQSQNDSNPSPGVYGKWNADCGNSTCYGVPLYRQYLTAAEQTDFANNPVDTPTGRAHRPSIRMMGGGTGARSALVMNHGSYYIDSSVSAKGQLGSSTSDNRVSSLNIFEPSQSYTFFLLFANGRTHQTYSIYVGKKDGFDLPQAKNIVTPVLVNIADATYKVTAKPGESWAQVTSYDKTSGIMTLTVDLTARTDFLPENRSPYCQPTTFCQWNAEKYTCGCKPGTSCTDNQVCSYGIGDVDCPTIGCFGFQVKLPDFFPDLRLTAANPPGPVAPPTPVLFTKATDTKDLKYFQKANVAFVSSDKSGGCHYPDPPQQTDAGFESTPSPTPIRVWQPPSQ